MTAQDFHQEGQRKLADAQLIPLLSHDLGLVVRRQLDHHPANAELIVWLLNHASDLLDVHQRAAEWVGELEEFYRAREVLDARGLSRTTQYIVGHTEARERLAEMLGWPLPSPVVTEASGG
ncbi:hypothetical protein ACPESR_25420 [Nocardia testacea]|uniref:hypothetical protein n=1 Tax=Nocardia testacea TaxID=248551 RepID=UPI003C2CDF99